MGSLYCSSLFFGQFEVTLLCFSVTVNASVIQEVVVVVMPPVVPCSAANCPLAVPGSAADSPLRIPSAAADCPLVFPRSASDAPVTCPDSAAVDSLDCGTLGVPCSRRGTPKQRPRFPDQGTKIIQAKCLGYFGLDLFIFFLSGQVFLYFERPYFLFLGMLEGV